MLPDLVCGRKQNLSHNLRPNIDTYLTDCGYRDHIQLVERQPRQQLASGGPGRDRHPRFHHVTASGDTAESVEAILSTSSSVSPLAVTVVLDHQEPPGGRAGDNFDPPDGATCVIS